MKLPKSGILPKKETEENSIRDKYGHDPYVRKTFTVCGVDGKKLMLEANWNSSVDKNRFLRLRIGEASIIVDNHDLRDIVKLLAPMIEVEDMMFSAKRFYETTKAQVKIIASKRYERGDEIHAQVTVPVRPV